MKKSPYLIIFLNALSALSYPLVLFQSTIFVRDWGLFNSLSLFNYSCFNYYHVWPIHNPYVLGGMDVLANPQARACSPMVIFDLFFHAPIANLISLFTLSFIGAVGMYKLLINLQTSNRTALLISFIFIHASWFHLHFAEGHIIFGSFLLIGWIILCALNIHENRYKLILALILAFMLLDGGMYAFIYAILTLILLPVFRFEGVSVGKYIKAARYELFATCLAVLTFVGLAALKIIPLLSLHANRQPIVEWIRLDIRSLLYSFFYPFGHIEFDAPFASYNQFVNFHEIGTYIGLASVIVIFVFIILNFSQRILPYVLITLLFGWMGSGWFWSLNPWRLIQEIPIINNAHIQTRCFFVVFVFTLLLLAKALHWLEDTKKLWWTISCFLILESCWLAYYPYSKLVTSDGSYMARKDFPTCIKNTTVAVTYLNPDASLYGFDFEHYRRKNAATKNYMDPSNRTTAVKAETEQGYLGEIYLIRGKGVVQKTSFIPGKIKLRCEMNSAGIIQFNTNYLGGWKSNQSVKVLNNGGLLAVNVPKGNYNIELYYWPKYLTPCFIMLAIGLISFSLLLWAIKHSKRDANLQRDLALHQ